MIHQQLRNLTRRSLLANPLYRFCSIGNYPHQDMFISVNQASKFINDKNVKFLDVRDIEQYKINHINANTYSADMFFWYRAMSDQQGIDKMKNEFQTYLRDMGVNNNDYLITYEDKLTSRYGASSRAYFMLKLLGHKYVSILNGGMHQWVQNGLETKNVIDTPQKGDFEAQWDQQEWVTKEDVHQQLINKDHKFIDVRDEVEWLGESSSPLGKNFVPRKGRLEGAIWMPWNNFASENNDGTVLVRDEKQITQYMEEQGIQSKDEPITIYCFKGARASLALCALRNAGYTNVKNYFGSWNEWSQDLDLPIDDRLLSL